MKQISSNGQLLYLTYGYNSDDFINKRYSFLLKGDDGERLLVSFPDGLMNNPPLLLKYILKKAMNYFGSINIILT